MTESQYDTTAWAAATTMGRRVFNYNFHMNGDELLGWALVKSVVMQASGDIKEIVYMWEKKASKGAQVVRVSVAEMADWRNAQVQLKNDLQHSMRTDIPTGTGKSASTGDINFVAKAPQSKVVDRIFFSRGNVSITVSSVGTKVVDITAIANTLDSLLSEPPPSRDIEQGVVSELSPKTVKVEAQETTKVLENLPTASARGAWLKFIAKEGEFRREDDSLYFTAEKAGKKSIGKYLVRK